MGWAGPAHPTGLGRSRPKIEWADIGPNNYPLLGQARPRRQDWARRIHLAQTKTGGGNYFPPTPACRTLFVLHAEKEKNKTQGGGRRRVTWRGGWWRRLGEAVAEAGGSRAAVLRLFPVAESEVVPFPFPPVFSPLSSFGSLPAPFVLCFFSFFPFSRLFPPPPLFSSLFIGKNGAGAPSITQRLVGQ